MSFSVLRKSMVSFLFLNCCAFTSMAYDFTECDRVLREEYLRFGLNEYLSLPKLVFIPTQHTNLSTVEGIRYDYYGVDRIILSSSNQKKHSYNIETLCESPITSGLSIVFMHEVFHFLLKETQTPHYEKWTAARQAYLPLFKEKPEMPNPYEVLIESFAIAGEIYYSQKILKTEIIEFNKKSPLVKTHFERLEQFKKYHTKKNGALEPDVSMKTLRNMNVFTSAWYDLIENKSSLKEFLDSLYGFCHIPSECLSKLFGMESHTPIQTTILMFKGLAQSQRWSFPDPKAQKPSRKKKDSFDVLVNAEF